MFQHVFRKSTPSVCMSRASVRGVTLVELLVSITLLSVVLSLALPSYREMIEKRQVTQGAEQVFAFLNSAQGIASRTNSVVTVSYSHTGEDEWCVGATLGATACDCTETVDTESDYCSLDGRLMVLNNDTVGNKGLVQSVTGDGSYAFDPVRGLLVDLDDSLEMLLHSPNDGYQLKLLVSNTGHSVLCSVDDSHDVPGYDLCPVVEADEPALEPEPLPDPEP